MQPDLLTSILNVEKQYMGMPVSYKRASELTGLLPSVIAQYAKAGLLEPVKCGKEKLIPLRDCYYLEAFRYLVKYYGFSYMGCKLFRAFCEKENINCTELMLKLKDAEEYGNITQEDLKNHVNSYMHRGIFQKQKNKKQG